ncbi:hypothetical protein D9V84_06230 [Bacteroidetes/Chlorobi group bacterium Naka2016]|jgi:sigma-B regulation protein RsbU (phosphoserine phosphatase)|nr:MAG: hypothetical protein D9V84_06230 [Bacteroidetes/Chlorobi group bacterium Naka2016]
MNFATLFINLDSLVELSNKLNSSRNVEFILNSVVLSLMGKLGFLRGGAFIVNYETKSINEVVSKGRFDRTILEQFLQGISKEENFDNIYYISKSQNDLKIAIRISDGSLVILVFDSRVRKSDLNPEENHYLSLVLNMTANALEIAKSYDILQKTNLELSKRNQLLTTIFELSRDFSHLLSKGEIVNHIKFRILGQLMVTKFALFYSENDKIEELVNYFDNSLPNKLIEYCLSLNRLLVLRNAEQDYPNEIIEFLKENGVQIISPLTYHNQTRGAMLLGRKYIDKPFTDEDINFIQALGNTVILAIENSRLFQEEINKKQIEKELQLALEIQKNLLPKEIPSFNKIDIWGVSYPAKIVGGDYFDIILPDENHLYFAIADVSGKSIPASLLMANVQSALRLLVRLNLPLLEIINQINSIIYHNTTAEKFITFFLGKLNLETFCLEYINAGHNPPIMLTEGTIQKTKFLSEGGLFLGFQDSPLEYEVGKEYLKKGDFILLYTDGVVECTNFEGKEFGVERLIDFLKSNSNLKAKIFCESLFKHICKYCDNVELSDDVSIVALKVK